MRDNGARIYAGLMEREDMQKLEEENQLTREKDFRCESGNSLAQLISELEQDKQSKGVK